jgi:hypothetical protein
VARQEAGTKKARRLSRFLFGVVSAVTLIAFVLLVLNGTDLDPIQLLRGQTTEFDWGKFADGLPDLDPNKIPDIFTRAPAYSTTPATKRPPGQGSQPVEPPPPPPPPTEPVEPTDAVKAFLSEGDRRRAWSRAELLHRMSLHFDFENSTYHLSLAQTYKSLGKSDQAAKHTRLAEKFSR